MSDLANTVGEVAQRTTSVSELVSQSSDLAYDGVKRAEVAGKGMEEIMRTAEVQAKTISDMSFQMEEIGGIVGVISGIAEQTSLHALNAAIEAARAGDAGLGFSVVADEVKSLAQEFQSSAEHIETIIGNLQKMSVEMTAGMTKASEAVQSGSNAVNETVTIFHHMAESILDVNRNMSEVAAASEEQAASVQEITASMSEVRNMVQDTAREATDSAAAAEEISASLDQLKETSAQSAQLAEEIAGQVNQFKIE
jgi:methyl-accepting chemotaxis protein